MQPDIIAGLVIARAKQWGKLARFVPEELHPNSNVWKYQTYDDAVALPANANPPGTEARVSDGDYVRISVEALCQRVKAFVDDWNMSWSPVDVVRNATDGLVDKIQRVQEYRIVQHATNFGQAAAGATLAEYGAGTYPTMASKDKTGTGWDHATDGGKNAIADLLEAKQWIANKSFYPADTLLIGADVEAALLNNADIRTAMYYGGQGPNVLVQEGRLGKLLGLDVIVLEGTYQDENSGAETVFMSDRAVVCHRGSTGQDLGIIHVSENLTTKTYRDDPKRGDWIEVWKTFEPHIWRPKCVVNIIDVLNPS